MRADNVDERELIAMHAGRYSFAAIRHLVPKLLSNGRWHHVVESAEPGFRGQAGGRARGRLADAARRDWSWGKPASDDAARTGTGDWTANVEVLAESKAWHTGADVALALDPAASSFARQSEYVFEKSNGQRTARDGLLALQGMVDVYPIVSVEDGFAENDWDGFRAQTPLLGDRIQIVGDDLYVTNPRFIRCPTASGWRNTID
jgi:hypothetical protein